MLYILGEEMSLEGLQRSRETMLDFRQRVSDYYEARQPLLDLKAMVNDSYFQPRGGDVLRRNSESYLPALAKARDRVGQLIAEATKIADGYRQPTQIKILPPPLIPGYSRTYNIFQAAIEIELPFDFQLPQQQVFDLVKQTIWAIEREIREVQEKPPRKLGVTETLAMKAGSGIASGFKAVFKTETDRVILKWIVYVGLAGLVLRFVFGVKLEILAKLLVDKVVK